MSSEVLLKASAQLDKAFEDQVAERLSALARSPAVAPGTRQAILDRLLRLVESAPPHLRERCAHALRRASIRM